MEEKTLEMEQEQTAINTTYEELPDAPANDTIPVGKILVVGACVVGFTKLLYDGGKKLGRAWKQHKEKKASKEDIIVEGEEISEDDSKETEKTE